MAWAIGGAVGGAITGGLEAGWKGALFGALGGGALGGIGAWGVGNFGWQFGAGMLVAGAGVAAATDSWDSFAGGLAGGVTGGLLGTGIVKSEQFQNWKAGNGFKSNVDVRAENRRIESLKAALGLTKDEITPSQKSIDYVVKKYDIETTYMSGKRPFYNPYQPDPGSTKVVDQLVTIGPNAFKSEGYLASVVGHEAQHAYDLGLTRSLYLTQPISELNATQWMMNNATRLYNTPREIAEFQAYYDYWSRNFWNSKPLK